MSGIQSIVKTPVHTGVRAVDLFAGLGGLTQGAVQAGVQVLWAGNHFPPAVDYHAINHPGIAHGCQDHHQQNFHALPDFDLALGAPCCQGHTHTRGKEQPWHEASRATAWCVIQLLSAKRPPLGLFENVPGFLNWDLRPAWEHAAQLMGYTIGYNTWDAADSGVPQNRVRLLMTFTKSKSPLYIQPAGTPHRPIADIIQWDRHDWRPIAEKVPATRERVANARAAGLGDRFVMPYYKSGSGLTGRSLGRPIGTITTKARWGVVDGDRMRMLHTDEGKAAMSFPAGYQLPNNVALANRLLGNAVCPAQAEDAIRALVRCA